MMPNREGQVPNRDQADHQGHQSHHQREDQSEATGSSCDWKVKGSRGARRAEIYGKTKSW